MQHAFVAWRLHMKVLQQLRILMRNFANAIEGLENANIFSKK